MTEREDTNVVEVNFRAAESGDEDDLEKMLGNFAQRTAAVQADLADLRQDCANYDRYRDWLEGQLDLYRAQNRELKKQLLAERARTFPYTDTQILAALESAFSGEPASATEIAKALIADRPTQSQRVRLGLALSALEKRGSCTRVAVVDHGDLRNRWTPKKAPDA